MPGRDRRRWPLTARATAVVIAVLALFAVLRIISASAPEAATSEIYTDRLVVVGVTDHYRISPTDAAAISADTEQVQAAAISVRPRYLAECDAAGWSTLGAGRRAGVDGNCDPRVVGSGEDARVADWEERKRAAALRGGDARLGTLGDLADDCVQAVGPGAALAAADADGRVQGYRDSDQFAADDYALDCPLTIVDAGDDSDRVITELSGRDDVTLIVTGIGHAPGAAADDPRGLQVIYRIQTTLPGLMTSDATRRTGLVTLTDLSRTLIDFTRNEPIPADAPLDGSAIRVDQQSVDARLVSDHLRQLANLSAVAPVGYVAGTAICVLAAAAIAVLLVRGRQTAVRPLLALLATMPATLMLTGAFPWSAEQRPTAALLFALIFWAALLTALCLIGARWLRLPLPVVAAGLALAAYTLDAALGAPMQPGSLLNSKPTQATRWYGFGNATFGCYATAALTVAGYLGHRLVLAGHRIAGPVGVLLLGGLVIGCQGWPTMGADFGGVIALTPAVLWLALATSGLRITWPRMIIIAAAAVLTVSAVSLLDWSGVFGGRSHLGNFVQRVFDGDAGGILIRKALAAAASLVSVYGAIGLVLGVTAWWLIFRRLRHSITAAEFPGYTPTAVAVIIAGIVGTALNDNAVAVWLTTTGVFVVYTAGLLQQRLLQAGWTVITAPPPGSGRRDRSSPARS